MPASTDDVLSLLVFARVVEAKSFTAGAARLGLSKSVASARIAQLEARLGTRLLLRTTRRLSLTADGLALYEQAARMAQAADDAAQLAGGTPAEPRGVLRINAPTTFGEMYLAQPIARYLEAHPRVRVELSLSDRFEDLVAERVDVAIRISAKLKDSTLVGRKLADDRSVVVASPAYLARKGTPETPADLIHHDCLRYTLLDASDEWRFKADAKSFSVPISARFEAQSGSALRGAALAGMGIAILPSFMIAPELASGQLTPILAPFTFVRLSVSAVYAPAKVVPGSVRAFVDLLVAHFAKPPWLAAEGSTGPRARGAKG
ncbi:MAG TPA: LysR family transcriptional regulator [Polyangiaceae bacterium]|nr:LysR family transcriptional regulator [Polyangiaceae bacterium]